MVIQYFRNRLKSTVLTLAILLITILTSNAGVFRTGQDLINDPNAVFPTRPPVVNGAELDFNTGTIFREILLDYFWKLPNTVSVGETLSIALTTRRLAVNFGDYDIGVMVTDGTNAFGGDILDNQFGSAIARRSLHSATEVPLTEQSGSLFTNASYPGEVELVTATFDITPHASTTDVNIAFLAGSGSHTFNTALDLTQPLRFLVVADEAGIEQNIASAFFEPAADSPAIPEPSTYVMMLLGVAVLFRRHSFVKKPKEQIK